MRERCRIVRAIQQLLVHLDVGPWLGFSLAEHSLLAVAMLAPDSPLAGTLLASKGAVSGRALRSIDVVGAASLALGNRARYKVIILRLLGEVGLVMRLYRCCRIVRRLLLCAFTGSGHILLVRLLIRLVNRVLLSAALRHAEAVGTLCRVNQALETFLVRVSRRVRAVERWFVELGLLLLFQQCVGECGEGRYALDAEWGGHHKSVR